MNESRKKKIKLLSILAAGLLLLVGVSYALARLTLSGNKNILMTVDNVTLSLTEDSSNAISLHGELPTSEAEGKAQTNAYKFVLNNTGSSSVTYDLYLENDSEAKSACGNCELIDNNYISYELKKEGSVVKTGKTDPTNPVISSVSIKAGEKQTYELRVWLNLDADNSVVKKYYFGRIKLDATQAIADSLVKRLVEDYTNNDTITTYTAGDKSKMYTFHQTAGAQQAGYTKEELTDYRYIGNVPNNYIKFNDELWRIIGVFTVEDAEGIKEQRVKITRNENIGYYPWDNSTLESSEGSNLWNNARLMKLLNDGYEEEQTGGSLYWNSQSGICYKGDENATTPCDFTSNGLREEAKNKIEEVKWYLGGSELKISGQLSVPYFYINERSTDIYTSSKYPRSISWTGKVALMYPSDYGYTFGLDVESICFENLNYCRTTNNATPTNSWMYGDSRWTIGVSSSSSSDLFYKETFGAASWTYMPDYPYGVFPTLYLKSKVNFFGGTGTSSDPFIVG